MTMISYEAGKRFPDIRYATHKKGCVIRFNEKSFDVIGVLSHITHQELQTWNSGQFKYGLFIQEFIPFLLIDFGGGFNFDCSFNIYKIKQESVSDWLKEKVNLVTFCLVDKETFTTNAVRAVGFQPSFFGNLKAALNQQHSQYDSVNFVEDKIQKYEASFTIEAMLSRAEVYSID